MQQKFVKNSEEDSSSRAQRRMAPRAKGLVDTPQARKATIAENLADKYLTRVSRYSFFIAAFEAAPKILYMFSQKLLDENRAKLDNYRQSIKKLQSNINVLLIQIEKLALTEGISAPIKGIFVKSLRSVPLSRDSIPANLS